MTLHPAVPPHIGGKIVIHAFSRREARLREAGRAGAGGEFGATFPVERIAPCRSSRWIGVPLTVANIQRAIVIHPIRRRDDSCKRPVVQQLGPRSRHNIIQQLHEIAEQGGFDPPARNRFSPDDGIGAGILRGNVNGGGHQGRAKKKFHRSIHGVILGLPKWKPSLCCALHRPKFIYDGG